MIAFDTAVRIEQPVDEVFAYVSDVGNLPTWNSAVESVRRTSHITFAMRRALPTGTVANDLEIVEHERPRSFAIRTTSGPTPFHYRFRFSPKDGATIVGLDAEAELGRGDLIDRLARHTVRRGVEENLQPLRVTLETGR
jgi:uncharacterized membrane protein